MVLDKQNSIENLNFESEPKYIKKPFNFEISKLQNAEIHSRHFLRRKIGKKEQ